MLPYLRFIELYGCVDLCFTSILWNLQSLFLQVVFLPFLSFWDSHYMSMYLMLPHSSLRFCSYFFNLFSSLFLRLDSSYWSIFKFTDSFFFHLKSTHLVKFFILATVFLNSRIFIGSFFIFMFLYWEFLFEDNCHHTFI